jgi:hypothetical protein
VLFYDPGRRGLETLGEVKETLASVDGVPDHLVLGIKTAETQLSECLEVELRRVSSVYFLGRTSVAVHSGSRGWAEVRHRTKIG